MAEHMAKQGHEVHVLITRSSRKRELEKRSGYQIHWFETPKVKGLKFFRECKLAIRYLEIIKPDLIHANCLLPGGYIAAKYAKDKNCKSLVLCYGYDVSDMKFPMSLWGRWALKHVDQVMAATEHCSKLILNWDSKLLVKKFLAGCDIDVFPELPLYENKQSIHLLFIGRLIPEKGLDFLLELMRELPDHYHLNVLGSGVKRDEYISSLGDLKERVYFQGQVPNSDCSKWFSQSHALVLPSYREPFGVVCIESIVSGVPVVCSDVMGIPEAVEDQKNGIIVKGREKGEWLSAIKKVCEDESLRLNVHSASKLYRENWSWNTRLKELEKIYQKLV